MATSSVKRVTMARVNGRTAFDELPNTGAREERKQRTRVALLDSALDLLEERSFAALSLREVARGAGVVPTAFYRHFPSLEALGLALIDDSFRTLRAMVRAARREPVAEQVIRSSVDVLVRHVHDHRSHFRFVVRERSSGVPAVRNAIRTEIRLFASELATDLARFPYLRDWSTEDLTMMAGLLVNAMVATTESLLDAPPDSPAAESEIRRLAEKQLRLVALGVLQWRSEG